MLFKLCLSGFELYSRWVPSQLYSHLPLAGCSPESSSPLLAPDSLSPTLEHMHKILELLLTCVFNDLGLFQTNLVPRAFPFKNGWGTIF